MDAFKSFKMCDQKVNYAHKSEKYNEQFINWYFV